MKSRSVLGTFRARLHFLPILAALTASVGCSGAPVDAEEEVAEGQEPIVSYAWIQWNEQEHSSGAFVTTGSAPSACEIRYPATDGGMSGGQMLAQRNSANKIQISWMSYSPWADWTQVGTYSFSTRPACAALDGDFDPGLASYTKNKQVALVAKGNGSSNRYWVATWMLGEIVPYPFGVVPTAGGPVRDWSILSTEAFDSAPAATVHDKKLLVAGRKADNSLRILSWPLRLDQPADPFTNGGPLTATTVPALPSGWAAAGDPAIIHVPAAFGSAVLAVRAVNGSSIRHYRLSTNGTTFSSWTRFANSVSAGADPALDLGYDRESSPRITAYVRSYANGLIWQASSNVGTTTFESFTSILSDTFVEGPAVVGGSLGFDGYHAAYGKHWGSDTIWGARADPVAP